MANDEDIKALKLNISGWNRWRESHPEIKPDLSGADLRGTRLVGANLSGANMQRTHLINIDLTAVNFNGANLREARFHGAHLNGATVIGACLNGAHISNSHLVGANLIGTDFSDADLSGTNFNGANLSDASFYQARMDGNIFADCDLRIVKGLETIEHRGPSEISITTIYRSEGKIPEAFLRECGIPDEFITQIPSLVAAAQPIQFYSCFISYSSKDDEFSRRLHSRMRQAGLRVWFAPEEMKGGEKLYEQIDRAIQVHDRLLLVLSENSLKSEWVMTELRRARKAEVKENRRKLFPISLIDFDALKEWECFDADQGKDLAMEVREYFIPDFSNWKDHDDFEKAFDRLLSDLKAST
jgi:hypothetical protein